MQVDWNIGWKKIIRQFFDYYSIWTIDPDLDELKSTLLRQCFEHLW